VATLREIARARTDLSEREIDRLHQLVAEWQLLSDLSFADLLLYVRVAEDDAYVVVAQMRPTTGQTSYVDDLVGTTVSGADRFLVDRSWREGTIRRDGDPEWQSGVPVRQEAIPVRFGDRVIAVISRDSNLASVRVPSQLELTYLQAADDLALMVSEGRFPSAMGIGGFVDADLELAPRVGDGLLRLARDGTVDYASPNAISALRRIGVAPAVVGEQLSDIATSVGIDDKRISGVLDTRLPADDEVEVRGAVVLTRALPLLAGDDVIGALVLLRDVTELRRRERQLLTKDATIREIHHRVKNNLQTVASLLRLQARRLTSPEAREALEESVRRVSAIALVHETLSQGLDESVDFDAVTDKVMAMISDVSTAAGTPQVRRIGAAGILPAELATPLALVVAELLQNAVEHAFADGAGTILEVRVDRSEDRLRVEVADDGAGLPATFSLERSTRLGLQIVRTLVVSEMGGSIQMSSRPEGGTSALLELPLRRG
jgi:two-component sensor histidine kinase